MTRNDRRTLVGRLAGLGWFTSNGETAATQAVGFLLEEQVLRDAAVNFLGDATGTDLSSVLWFETERIHADGGRPDIEGLDSELRPLVVIEGKFEHHITPDQIRAYLRDQQQRMGDEARGAFVLLVPGSRAEFAREVLASVLREDRHDSPYSSGTAVVTWDEWLTMWERATEGGDTSPRSLASDLVQLREVCRTLGGLVIRPMASAAGGSTWREREADLAIIVDQVTATLTQEKETKLLPIGKEPGFHPRRYVWSDLATDRFYAIGVRPEIADQGSTPLWMRYHADTAKRSGGVGAIRARIATSLPDVPWEQDDQGSVWFPLELDGSLAGPELVRSIIEQIQPVEAALLSK
jgi:hypothetical protein